MSTLEGTTMHPRCHHIGACWDLLEWFQLFDTSQNSISNFKKSQTKYKSKFNFDFFWKKIKFLCCSTREDLFIDVSITNVGLILTKLWWFLFSGYGQTDRHGFGILTWKHVGTQKILTQSSKLVVSRRSLYASRRTGMHENVESWYNKYIIMYPLSIFIPFDSWPWWCEHKSAGRGSFNFSRNKWI